MSQQDKQPTTSAQDEGLEFFPDSQRRFEETFDKVVKARPIHRTAVKPIDPNRVRRRADRRSAKSND